MSHSSQRPRRRRAPGSVVRRMADHAVLPGLGVTTLAALVAWLVRGEWAAVSAGLGGALGVGIFFAGLVGIVGVVAGPAEASMAGAFALLVAQLIVGAGILYLLSRLAWTDMLSLGLGFLAAGLTFQVGVVVGYVSSRQLVFGGQGDSDVGGLR